MATGDKPVKVFKHRGISVSVFENSAVKDGETMTFYKASVRRTFKQGDEFASNANFGREEIPIVRLLLDRAWQFMLEVDVPRSEEEPDPQPTKRSRK